MKNEKRDSPEKTLLMQLSIDVAALKQDVKWLKRLVMGVMLPLLLLILGILLKP